MASELNVRTLLKIGLYNDEKFYDLEDYKKHFDIIILHDGSLEPVEEILKLVLQHMNSVVNIDANLSAPELVSARLD